MFAFFAWWCLQYNLVLFGKCETVLCWISKLAKPWTLNSALKNVVYFRHCIYRYIETRTRDAVNTNFFVSGAELFNYPSILKMFTILHSDPTCPQVISLSRDAGFEPESWLGCHRNLVTNHLSYIPPPPIPLNLCHIYWALTRFCAQPTNRTLKMSDNAITWTHCNKFSTIVNLVSK